MLNPQAGAIRRERDASLGSLIPTAQSLPTSWDWQGGEAAPMGIRTPWLAHQWHYDEQGRIVPNNPDNPLAPWNRPGSTQTYEDWLGQQQPSSMFQPTAPSSQPPTPKVVGGMGQMRDMYGGINQLLEAIRRARGMRGGY